ncbi:MAG TPA: aminomethyl-transferring glycine dehydrogenase subunit GcvPA [Trueperaceae bacterium]|nr:aminomethyl-transferring glycine dehydrogenase subunit GcvPA [Trueperaceae bacterium]
MHYHPHTEADVRRALEAIGVASIDDLFNDLPSRLRNPHIDMASGMDESTLLDHLRGLAAKNVTAGADFLGGGVQRHFVPSVTAHLAMQSEFVTAYTPYQPEVAQGILQATFEFQTIMSELTGLPVSNASMYDGASATAEAALLAVRQTGRHRIVVSRGVHPETRQVLLTYLEPLGVSLDVVDLDPLVTLPFEVGSDVAGVIVQQPNYLGYLERMQALTDAAHAAGALMIAVVEPLSLAVLAPPGEYGADVAVGDGQTLGNFANFGGPHFGFMVVREDLIRQFPGRIVGQTTDVDGKRAFVLTLQAREQHIRRSKAKSNICSNHQLTALMATVNVSALGAAGIRDIAVGSVQRAHELAERLTAAGFSPLVGASYFNEFVLPTSVPASEVRSRLAREGVHAGVAAPAEYGFGDAIVLSATERTSTADIERLITALGASGVTGGRPAGTRAAAAGQAAAAASREGAHV